MRPVQSQVIEKFIFSEKYFRKSKMDKNKCPNFDFQKKSWKSFSFIFSTMLWVKNSMKTRNIPSKCREKKVGTNERIVYDKQRNEYIKNMEKFIPKCDT